MSLATLEHLQAKVASRRAGIRADAPAKINLTLEVLGRRGDGYHELRSLVIGVDFADQVRCWATSESHIILDCNEPALCSDDNLATRAAQALADHCNREANVHIDLQKRIPIGAGLGGGSSNAATTLRLCNSLWRTGLDDAELAAIGSRLGSDVPLFFSLPGALIEGRGERVSSVRLSWSGWVLLVFPSFPVSTAEAYRAYRPADSGGLPKSMDCEIPYGRSAAEISTLLTNHLEPAVFRVCPPLASLRDELISLGLTYVRVTGSGSALFGLFDDQEPALRAADKIQNRMSHVTTVVAAAPVGQGPIFSEEC